MAAASSTVPNRAMGILESMKSIWLCDIWSNMGVWMAAGVMQLTRTPVSASSLPNDLVSAITAALLAL